MKRPFFQQPKLTSTVSTVTDLLQRKCACGQHTDTGSECVECRKKKGTLQRTAVNHHPSPQTAPPIVHDVLGSPGQPLDSATRAYMEPRFGHDFSQVRIHTNAKAAKSAREIDALAYTVGQNVVFGERNYAPMTDRGKQLLAHELTHVIQQSKNINSSSSHVLFPPDAINTPLEREAERNAKSTLKATVTERPISQNGLLILRQTQRQLGSHFPRSPLCSGRRNITTVFRDFVTAVPGLIANIQGLDQAEKTRLTSIANVVLHSEGAADIDNYQVVACTSINSPLSLPNESTSAYVDATNREVGLLNSYEQQILAFRRNPSKEALLPILLVIAHEKRHVTLGSAVSVAPGNLRAGVSASSTSQAAYRVEEILTKAEEIAFGRSYTGSGYIVSREEQNLIFRHWNTVKSLVSSNEATRLRNVIIGQLRSRYGSTSSCDNAISLGVLSSMESGRWYSCSSRGQVIGIVPAGLNLCVRNGRHRVCGSAVP